VGVEVGPEVFLDKIQLRHAREFSGERIRATSQVVCLCQAALDQRAQGFHDFGALNGQFALATILRDMRTVFGSSP